ncbi:MAG: protein kinase [Elusimicrobia bacterium]|nr:protein kinase [Elusimicrobiota bacterium]
MGGHANRTGDHGTAIEAGNQLSHTHPNRPDGHIVVGDAQRGMGNPQEAARSYERATQIDPRNAPAWNGLSQAQFDQGDLGGAVASARNALNIDPSNAQARSMVKMYGDRAAHSDANVGGGAPSDGGNRGSIGGPSSNFRAFNEEPQSAEARPSNTLTPAQASSQRHAADSVRYLQMGDKRGAVTSAERALSAEPENKRAFLALFRALLAQRNFEAALKTANRGLEVFPGDALMTAMKANALNLMGRYQEALVTADEGLKVNPTSPELMLSKGFALSGLGQFEAARSMFRQAGKDARFTDFSRQAMAVPDDELVAFFTGTLVGPSQTAKPVEAPAKKFNWLKVAAGIGAGLLLVLFGLSRSGDFMDSIRRRRGVSPAVVPIATPPPHDGLAASGFRVEKKIGQGGMGVVYLGTDVSLDRPVAIKKMREEIRADPHERERFLREAKTVASLRHPHIVEIYSIVEDGSDVYMVFEYITGKTVHDLTYERGALPFAYAAGVVRAVSSALDYSHRRGVIHRDLKPSNIMVEEDGLVKVMDFGVARQAKDSLSRMSMTNTVVGTPPYMAPEQEQGIVRKESDVYALAVCLYEMVTGSLPFQGVGAGMLMAKLNKTYVPPSRVIGGLPQGFDAVMAIAFDPDPDKRMRTAGELVQALDALPIA